MIDKILLRRRHMVTAEPLEGHEQSVEEKAMALAVAKNMEAYGFTLDKEMMDTLFTYDKQGLMDFHKEIMPALKEMTGADKEYHPLYPNFPQQVMDAEDAELFVNAVVHYWSCGELFPKYEKDERIPLVGSQDLALLSHGTHKDLMDVFHNMAASAASLSSQDKSDMKTIMHDYPDYVHYMPDAVPVKENVAFIGKTVLEESPEKDASVIRKYFRTATDVLRLTAAMSDADTSLSGKVRFRKMSRPERRMVMDLLAGCENIQEDMFRYQYQWIRAGETLHPGEFKGKQYDDVRDAFHVLRNGPKPEFYNAKLKKAMDEKNIGQSVTLLEERPGEFARRLDKVLRDAQQQGMSGHVLERFSAVAESVSTPVLWQAREHFLHRNDGNPVRAFIPKGNTAHAFAVKNELPLIDNDTCAKAAGICEEALRNKYAAKDAMGKVYIGEEMKNYIVPFSQRSASNSTKSVARGSRIPVSEDAKVERGFIWWTNAKDDEPVDIDLSVSVYDENWGYMRHVSYSNLRDKEFDIYHSGDITNGGPADGKGAAEFIDFDIDKIGKEARYAVFQVYSYSQESFSELPNVRFGWMDRESFETGEIFEPSTVKMSVDVNVNSQGAIPAIIDCQERKVIWCDLSMSHMQTARGGNNLESNLKGTTAACYAIEHMERPTLYDLVRLNAEARGEITYSRDEADIIFSNDHTQPAGRGSGEAETSGEKIIPIVDAYQIDYFYEMLAAGNAAEGNHERGREEPNVATSPLQDVWDSDTLPVINDQIPVPEDTNRQDKEPDMWPDESREICPDYSDDEWEW